MSIKIMSRVWEKSQLKGSELLLLLAIADNARDDGHAWPGLTTLAEKTRLSRQTVSKKLGALVESSELYIHAMKGYVHHYVVLIDMDPADQAEVIAKIEEKRGQKSEYETGGGKHGVTVGEPVNTGRRPWETRGDDPHQHGATRSVNNRQQSSTVGAGAPEQSKSDLHQVLTGLIARRGFDLTGELARAAYRRAGKISKAVRELDADVDPDKLERFFDWYAREYEGINPPRDADKFLEHYALFVQSDARITSMVRRREDVVT